MNQDILKDLKTLEELEKQTKLRSKIIEYEEAIGQKEINKMLKIFMRKNSFDINKIKTVIYKTKDSYSEYYQNLCRKFTTNINIIKKNKNLILALIKRYKNIK